jgi:queuine tRNA-ribosyltransferase
MNRHEVHVFANGKASIWDREAGETMHSEMGPDEEARSVYLEQTRLAERLTRMPAQETGPLVLYDIGMGIASNALAAMRLTMCLKDARPLHLVSFENSLRGLELALQDPAHFKTQDEQRDILETLISERRWQSADGRILWELRLGDFLNQELAPEPEVIFFDFFSPQSSPDLWTSSVFKRLFTACSSRRLRNQSTVLATYSAATFARSALLLAGFYVGYGLATSHKSETTLVSTRLGDLAKPLGKTWTERLKRSSKPLPVDIAFSEHEAVISKILAHPQFSSEFQRS